MSTIEKTDYTDRDMKVAILNVAEIHAREYAGQSASGNAHVDIRALSCIQGSSRFVHEAFRKPIRVDTVLHAATGESVRSDSETKSFIH